MWARRLGRATPALACGCLGWSSYNQVHCETAPSFTVGSYNVPPPQQESDSPRNSRNSTYSQNLQVMHDLCSQMEGAAGHGRQWQFELVFEVACDERHFVELRNRSFSTSISGRAKDILRRAQLDVICLQEVEKTDVERIVADLGPEYTSHYFKHPEEGRPPDGLLIAVKTSCTCASPSWSQCDFKGKVIFGGVNFQLAKSGARVRVVNGHMRGGNQKQLDAFAAFGAEGDAQIEVITADFNEDFEERSEGAVFCPFKGQYVTLRRSPDLPQVSRPGNKQAQTPGQGLKIDYIWVRERSQDYEAQLSFDDASRRAILESHKNCEATGQWPSDHGCEALNIRVLPRRSWWQFWK
ncbi:unnamed protein product [Durusdinium trenchii]|uniref:Endonuclease/exonuclease/phosphatase domain-containing protein n=1 Tax=Durusdinium trenchii TaxID=1381693 RepID=A0ABP0SYH9_9DINO